MTDTQRDILTGWGWTQQGVGNASFRASPVGVSFTSVDTGPKIVNVSNVGVAGADTGVAISKDSAWIDVNPVGEQDANNINITIKVVPGSLPDGIYSGNIIITPDDSAVNGLLIGVTMELPGVIADEPAPGTLLGDLLYEQLEPMQPDDEDLGWPLRTYARALGAMGEEFHELASTDPDDGRPGMTRFLNADKARWWELQWLGQFAGVEVPPLADSENTTTYAARERARIKSQESYSRGTVPALIRAVQQTLIGNRTVIVHERDTSPYHITVVTWANETPDPVATEAAARSQKYAGLIMAYSALAGQDWATLRDGSGGRTWQDVKDDFANWEAVRSFTP